MHSAAGKKPFRLVVLISGSGSNLQAFIDAVADGTLSATIAAVISNKADAFGLERAQKAGIHTQVIDHRPFPNREAYDAELVKAIDAYQPDLVVLAGFMRILSDMFVTHYAGRLINIHPSLLPKFPGLDTHARAIAAGEREHGCSVHFVNGELDGGPLVAQVRVPVFPDDDATRLRERVQKAEHVLYPRVAGWLAEGRITLDNDTVVFDGKRLQEPIVFSEAE